MAQSEDILVNQGTDVSIKLECFNPDGTKKIFKKVDANSGGTITPFSANAKIKKSFTADSSTAIAFGTSFLDNANDNILQLNLTNAQTSVMKAGRYVYDVELSALDSDTGVSTIERILQGTLTVTPGVS